MVHPTTCIDRRRILQGFGAMLLATACCPEAGHPPHDGGEAVRKGVLGPPRPDPLASAAPESVGMSAEKLDHVFARLERRVADELFPGFSALVVRQGKIVAERAFGKRVRGGGEAMTPDTMFDVESMTKVISTAISALVLVEGKKLALTDPVMKYLPEFKGQGKEKVTVADMLRYTSGLPLDNHVFDAPKEDMWRRMAETPLEYAPGSKVVYSDLTYRLLGRLLEKAAGMGLDVFAREHVWRPIGMMDTMYNPPADMHSRVAATGATPKRPSGVRGQVQDDQDFALGGVCGCDGVFTTAKDVAVFCQMVLAGGVYGNTRLISPELAAQMVKNQTPFVEEKKADVSPIENLVSTPKGYGFELHTRRFSNGGTRLSPGSYGKAGGAGTFMWIDPERQLIGVLLTNHGLPIPFDERGWDRMLDDVGPGEFYDGIVGAVEG